MPNISASPHLFAQTESRGPRARRVAPYVESGFSIVELLVTFLILSVLMSSAISNLAAIKNPLIDGVNESLGFVKQVRARAIATTSAYHIAPSSGNTLSTSYSSTCTSATTTADARVAYALPNGARFTNMAWSVCFDSRGLAQGAQNFSLVNDEGQTETVQIFLGGAARVQP